MNRPENNANNPQQQPRHLLRLVAGIILVVLALPVLAGLILAARFNPNKYAPALITAVEQATGRRA
jgi:AsmA protein